MDRDRRAPARVVELGRRALLTPWRGRSRPSARRVLTWLLVGLAVVVPSAAWGVSTARAEAGLGPHMARYEVTLDHAVTIDLGPLGTLVIDSPLPLTLGARVVVQEIPREVTALQGIDTLDALVGDLESYVQFFSSPRSTVEVAVRALVADAVRRTLLASAALALVVILVRVSLGPGRRGELVTALRPHRATVAAAGVITLVVVGTLSGSSVQGPREGDPQASAVFDGTPLEGARITGRLAGVIDTYGGYVVDAYRDNEEFYAAARSNLVSAWAARAEADVELARIRDSVRSIGVLTAPEAEPPPFPPRATEEEDEEPAAEPVTMLVVSDLHCNVGMAPVIRAAAELAEVDMILNAGDTTVNGTAVESYCVTAFANAAPPGTPVVVADGNHDSSETSAQGRAAGWEVLDGAVVDMAGVRILGDRDPRATRIGAGTTLAGEETLGQVSARLAETACEAPDGVDLMLVHDAAMAAGSLEQGCVPAVVAGHMHRRIGPLRYGEGVRYISASTAGASLGQPTVGPLNGIAEMTVLRFDPTNREVLDYRLIRVHPDTHVTVGFAVRWPGAPLESVRTAAR